MPLQRLGRTLRQMIPALAPRDQLVVECVGLSGDAETALQSRLDQLSSLLSVSLRFSSGDGDIVFVDSALAGTMPSDLLAQAFGHRPVVAVASDARADLATATPYLVSGELRPSELLQTLRTIPLVRKQPASARKIDARRAWLAAMDGWKSTEAAFVRDLLTGMLLPESPALAASWGPGENVMVDFLRGQVRIDASAWERLCVRHELPGRPGETVRHNALSLDLDRVVWATGAACAMRPLLGADPQRWRAQRIKAAGRTSLRRYSLKPSHLTMAELLVQRPMTPLELMQRSRVSESDLRAFLQASLFVGLTYWN